MGNVLQTAAKVVCDVNVDLSLSHLAFACRRQRDAIHVCAGGVVRSPKALVRIRVAFKLS